MGTVTRDTSIIPASGLIVVYDTEFTSWAGFREQGFSAPGRYPEIIQIGAVKLDASDGLAEVAAFEQLVMPVKNPTLSEYIIELTGITQASLDEDGVPFADALDAFIDFIGDETTGLYAYGSDADVIAKNCDLNGMPALGPLPPQHNLRRELTTRGLVDGKAYSSELPRLFGVADDHPDHDALGDARSLAVVLRYLREKEMI